MMAAPPGGRRTSLFLVDGAREDVFEYLAARGDLPNICRLLLEPGGVTPATTVFPSTTGVAYLPFLTGCYPGTCNVPGIRWLDTQRYGGDWWGDREHVRSYCGYQGGRLNSDLADGLQTLFDLIPDSVGLCTPFTRGLRNDREGASLARKVWGSVAHYTSGYGPLDRAVGAGLCQLASRGVPFVFAVFPGVDGVTHFYDPWHPAVLDMYRAIDETVGAYARAGGMDGDHLTLLVSDHGLSRVARHTDVSLELEAMGLATLRHPLVWRRNPQVAVMVSGNASAQVYLQPGVRRTDRFTVASIEGGRVAGIPEDLPQRLAALAGVAMTVGVDDGCLTLLSRTGRAHIRPAADGEGFTYEPGSADVLEYGGPATMTDREWLVATLGTRFPDAPVQLTQLFRAPRTGDLVVIADEGTDLRLAWEYPEHRSGHGSLIRDHMRCLVAANRRLDGPVRTVDLFPLILGHLGIAVPDGIDGRAPTTPGDA